jgi:hypothetical protein
MIMLFFVFIGVWASLCASQLVAPTQDPGLAAFQRDLSARLDGAVERSLAELEQIVTVQDMSSDTQKSLLQSLEQECTKFKLTLLVHLESLAESEIERFLDERDPKEPLRAWESSSVIGTLREIWKEALTEDLSFWATTDLSLWASQQRALSDSLSVYTQRLENLARRSGFE